MLCLHYQKYPKQHFEGMNRVCLLFQVPGTSKLINVKNNNVDFSHKGNEVN